MGRIEAGEADLSPLGLYVEAVNRLRKEVEDLRGVAPNATNDLTDRFVDQNLTAGHRVYVAASSHLSNAFEHHDALWALIYSEFGMTPRAPWSLLRPIFESGFWATWVLDPRDSFARRRRGLRLELSDDREERAWINELPLPDEAKRAAGRGVDAERVYRAEAKELRLDWKDARRLPPVVEEIKLTALAKRDRERDLGAMLAATWRSLSGQQHGYPWALMRNSNMPEKIPVQGGFTGVVSVNDDAFIVAAKASYALLIEAASLYVSRSTKHSSASGR